MVAVYSILNCLTPRAVKLPPLPLPDDVLELLEAIATGELFRNPLEGLVNSALGAIGDVTDSVVDAIPEAQNF